MQIHQLVQGSPSWHAHRATHFNASDAPAMMGCGLKSRNELLAELHNSIRPEVSDYVQEQIFDPGHRFEALARPLAIKIIGED
jgi:predicted phage-related endonuclease